MDSRVKHSTETRIEAARLFDAGFSYWAAATKLRLSRHTLRQWQDKHRQGRLLDSVVMGNKKYSAAVKVAAVEKFLAGATKAEVLTEFGISGRGLFNKWVAIYRLQGAAGLEPKRAGRKARGDKPETLEEEVARLRLENAVLKKLNALAAEGDPRMWVKPGSSRR